MEPAGGKKCQSGITWCSVHCLKAGELKWWFEKVMLGGRTLRNITVTGILVEGSFTTESFKGVMCNISWLLSLTSSSPKTDALGYCLFEPCDYWHFLDMLMSLKQHNSWFGAFNIGKHIYCFMSRLCRNLILNNNNYRGDMSGPLFCSKLLQNTQKVTPVTTLAMDWNINALIQSQQSSQ